MNNSYQPNSFASGSRPPPRPQPTSFQRGGYPETGYPPQGTNYGSLGFDSNTFNQQTAPYGQREGYNSGLSASQGSYGSNPGSYTGQQPRTVPQMSGGMNPQSFSNQSGGINPSQLGGGVNPAALGGGSMTASQFSGMGATGMNPSDLLARMDSSGPQGSGGIDSSLGNMNPSATHVNERRTPSTSALPTTLDALATAMAQNTIPNIAQNVGINLSHAATMDPAARNNLHARLSSIQKDRAAAFLRQKDFIMSGSLLDLRGSAQGVSIGQGHPSQGRGGPNAAQLALYNQQLAASQNAQQQGLDRPSSSQRIPSQNERMASNGTHMPPPSSVPRPNTAGSIARPGSAMGHMPTMANGALPRQPTGPGSIPRPPSAMSRSTSQSQLAGEGITRPGTASGISRPPTAGSGMIHQPMGITAPSELDMSHLPDGPPSRTGTSHSMHAASPRALTMNLNGGDLSSFQNGGGNRSFGDGAMNGHPATPKLQTQGLQHPSFNSASMAGSPVPTGSPFQQGLKRKAPGGGLDSPQLASAGPEGFSLNGGSMGPPGIPRQVTGEGAGMVGDLANVAQASYMVNGLLSADVPAGPAGMNLDTKPTMSLGTLPSRDLGLGQSPVRGPLNAAPFSVPTLAPPPTMPIRMVPDLAPLPASVNLNPLTTNVTTVPLKDSLELIPSLSDTEIKDVRTWIKVDSDYHTSLNSSKARALTELAAVDQVGWWEKKPPGGEEKRYRQDHNARFDIRYPQSSKDREREREREREKFARDNNNKVYRPRREGFRLPRRIATEDTNRPEVLVPIRLEFDVDQHNRMRDTFIWNLNDPVVTPEIFAQSMCEDYALASSLHGVIVKSIQDQLSDFQAHVSTSGLPAGLMEGRLGERDTAWWSAWRKRVEDNEFVKESRATSRKRRKVKKEIVDSSDEQDNADDDRERPMDVDEFDLDERRMQDDLRILIKLDIIVGSVKLDDQFEWDVDNLDSSPEQFAEVYAQELGLAGEFKTAIAHCIREQVQAYQKSLFIVGRPTDGSALQDDDLRSAFLPGVASGARPTADVASFTPVLNYMSDSEIAVEREKDTGKRRKRNPRGRRGAALPERDTVRTCRTPAIGFPELDASVVAAMTTTIAPRRAAAAAASLTIANMAATENGETHTNHTHTPIQSQQRPSAQPTASSSKDKKQKGIFKAPALPPSVLRPRATVTAPTPSTGLPAVASPVSIGSADERGESKSSRTTQVKRSRETERENKNKEYAGGQHSNMIGGVWHCSNCGCPESIATGRRKGPLGVKTQCGDCGIYWHRHHRPKPVEWNPDTAFHKAAQQGAKSAKRRGLRAQGSTVPSTPAEEDTEQEDVLPRARNNHQALSPISSVSSASDTPPSRAPPSNGTQPASPKTPAAAPPPTPSSNGPQHTPPEWLLTSSQNLRTKYPADLWEITIRKAPAGAAREWRIRCTDCPGKLYTPGPDESLDNYEVHLKNKAHRQKVANRLNGMAPGA